MAHEHPAPSVHHIVPGFGADRAAHYDAQASVNLAGSQAVYELGVSVLTAQLDSQDTASPLFVGLGTGAELVPYTRFDVPGWRFTGVEPSDAMLAVARKRLEAEGLLSRTHLHVGELHTLPPGPSFDGAQMMCVLHHVEGNVTRSRVPRSSCASACVHRTIAITDSGASRSVIPGQAAQWHGRRDDGYSRRGHPGSYTGGDDAGRHMEAGCLPSTRRRIWPHRECP